MRLPNHPNPALHKRDNRRIVWPILGAFSLPLIFLTGCSGGAPSMAPITGFFSSLSPFESPTPKATPTPTPTPAPAATPEAEEIKAHPGKKPAKQAHTVSRPPSNATAPIGGEGRGAVVSLEPNPGGVSSTPATPPAPASAATAASVAGTPTLSSSAMESSGTGDASPAKAAKLIQDIDKIERRVDRQNLSADDSQRDILAQKLLLEAKESLSERDSVAAISLATKASTLLAPLPKLADSAIPSAP